MVVNRISARARPSRRARPARLLTVDKLKEWLPTGHDESQERNYGRAARTDSLTGISMARSEKTDARLTRSAVSIPSNG
jgi:hypothetical protein